MRSSILALCCAALVATSAHAQRRLDIDRHFGVFMDQITTASQDGSGFENLGFGANFDFRPLVHYKVRATAAYDRVATHLASQPNRYTTASLDVLYYPTTSGDFRFYVFGGVAYTRVVERTSTDNSQFPPVSHTTSGYNLWGPNLGIGAEYEMMFAQFRLPPAPKGDATTPARYGAMSLGVRF